MANLATLAATFTELETQKNTVTRAISELEYLKTSKIIAQLSFIVASVDKNVADVVNLSVSPAEANLSLAKLRNLAVGKSTELQLTTKDVTITVSCEIDAKEYNNTFNVKDIDDNNSLSTELELLSNDQHTIKVHIKATYDTIDGLLASKHVELSQVEVAKAEVVEEIKKKKTSTTKKEKKVKKTSKQEVAQDTAAVFDVDEEQKSLLTKGIETVTEAAIVGVQQVLAHRAVVMFVGASWAIFALGEYASI